MRYEQSLSVIQKHRRRYYLTRAVSPDEQKELLTFCTLDPVRHQWYCMNSKQLIRWLESHEDTLGRNAPMLGDPRAARLMKRLIHPKKNLTVSNESHRNFVASCLALLDWEHALTAEEAGPATIRIFQRDVRMWLQWLLDHPEPLPEFPESSHADAYVTTLQNNGIPESTTRRVSHAIRKFLKYLAVRNLTVNRPTEN